MAFLGQVCIRLRSVVGVGNCCPRNETARADRKIDQRGRRGSRTNCIGYEGREAACVASLSSADPVDLACCPSYNAGSFVCVVLREDASHTLYYPRSGGKRNEIAQRFRQVFGSNWPSTFPSRQSAKAYGLLIRQTAAAGCLAILSGSDHE